MAEDEEEPKIESLEFSGKLTGTLQDINAKVSQIPYYNVRLTDAFIEIAKVESRNVRKDPFLFYIVKISKDSVSVTYSIAPGTSDTMRRAIIVKDLSGLLSVINDEFQIDQVKFYQYIDSSIEKLMTGLSQSYSVVFNKFDALSAEYRELKKLASELTVSNRNLTIQTSQLGDENKMLSEQLKSLQTYSDEALMAMVEDWIEVHNSSIDVGEFSKTYKVPEPRVEQILNKMVSMNYIELRG